MPKDGNLRCTLVISGLEYDESGTRMLLITILFQLCPEILITQFLFFFGKVDLPKLLRIVFVVQHFITKLLTGQVKYAVIYHIEAVESALRKRNSVNLASEIILYKEGRD